MLQYARFCGVSAWLGEQGLPVSWGTLAGSVSRFALLFARFARAVLAYEHATASRLADGTTWRVRALRGLEGRAGRVRLWTAAGSEAVRFHIGASRRAEAAGKLFGDVAPETVIVWAHLRRDFSSIAPPTSSWPARAEGWLARLAAIYRVNEARLACYGSGIEPPGARRSRRRRPRSRRRSTGDSRRFDRNWRACRNTRARARCCILPILEAERLERLRGWRLGGWGGWVEAG